MCRTPGGAKGKRWLACWLDPNEQEHSKAFTNKTPANKYWRDLEAAHDRGEYIDPKAGRELVDSIAQRWFGSRKVDPSTAIKDESVYRLHVRPVFGHRRVKAVKPSEVQEFRPSSARRTARPPWPRPAGS